MLFEPHQTIVFIGDSITDAERTGSAAPYGDGYVNMVDMLLQAHFPELGLHVLNRGVGGDTVRHLAARWHRDVLAQRPHQLSIMVGINDVWRAWSDNPHEAVPLREYDTTLRDLIAQTQAHSTQVILMTPFLIEPDQHDLMRRQTDLYANVVRRIAADTDAVLVDTQAAFDAALARHGAGHWSGDRVHPSVPGHALLARVWLEAMGIELGKY
jgi:lysophospholipase L1-like esterase